VQDAMAHRNTATKNTVYEFQVQLMEDTGSNTAGQGRTYGDVC